MTSLVVSSNVVTINFDNKLVVWSRSASSKCLSKPRVVDLEPVKDETESSIVDGGVPTVCSAISDSGKYFISSVNKTLYLWETSTWSLLGKKAIARASSCITFSKLKEDKIIITDKSGDAYVYSVEQFSNDAGSLLLGHVSMLLKVVITPDDKYVITCDRDEKIRVSHFPNAYNIQTFCLGHTDCVTCLDFPVAKSNLLMSGSSDGSIRLWDYSTGKQLLQYNSGAQGDEQVVVDVGSFYVNSSSFIVCAILKSLNRVRLLLVDHGEHPFKCTFLQDVLISCTSPRALAVNKNEVFILSHDSPHFITAFECVDRTLIPLTELNEELQNVTREFNNDFHSINNRLTEEKILSYLNKRRIDDTQDYYRRKNERLGIVD